jgi:hypothetical protein
MGFRPTIQMNVEHFDYIAVYKDVYPEGFCEHVISEFDRLASGGAGSNRQQFEGVPKHMKDDHQIFLNLKNHSAMPFDGKSVDRVFFEGLQACYDQYSSTYSTLKQNGDIRATALKLQKTSSGGGYHVWHGEQGSGDNARRVVTYMLYLNTMMPEDGAETEFLYQRKRISPVKNTMVIWPAAYTHAHRGNPVLGAQAKYIATGWFYYE